MLTRSDIAKVNQAMRTSDQSHLWPIRGKFSATERAIRWARREGIASYCETPGDYRSWIDAKISEIVNDPKNW